MQISTTYLILNLGAIAIPFLAGFHPKLKFYKQWKYVFPAMFLVAIPFILWDEYFTAIGVWGFNETYLLGPKILGLPFEEVLFFICIPYACVFTYDAFGFLLKQRLEGAWVNYITIVLAVGLLITALFNFDRIYTFTTFISLTVLLFLLLLRKRTNYLGRFYFVFLLILIPFFLINGVLTGSWIDSPVVWYNDSENLGIRMLTIPIEDTFYGMLLLLLNVSVLEQLKRKY